MAGGSSEEKNLPPSAKKLRDARKKGQVAKAPDLVTALAALGLLGYLVGGADWMGERLRAGMAGTAAFAYMPFDDALRQVLPLLGTVLMQTVGPALAIVLVAVILTSSLVNGGFLFALDPLKPKLGNLDPIKGLGKLFALKNLIEVLKSVVKALLLGTVAVELALNAAGTLVQLPFCGTRCIGPVTADMLRPMVGAACGLYLFTGGVDMLLQRWLFLRDMKMSVTEQKRERKDQDGDPHIKGAQRQQRREMASGSVRLGLSRATVLVAGDDAAVGLRYVRGETDIPTVVCRAGSAGAAAMIEQARNATMPLFWDNALATRLASKLRPGWRVTPEFFQQVAQALYLSGAVRG